MQGASALEVLLHITRLSLSFHPMHDYTCNVTNPVMFCSNSHSLLKSNAGPNAPALVRGLCTVVVWTAPTRTYGRVIGYNINFVVPPGSNNVTISKGCREMFHVIEEDEVPTTIRGDAQVQVRDS